MKLRKICMYILIKLDLREYTLTHMHIYTHHLQNHTFIVCLQLMEIQINADKF